MNKKLLMSAQNSDQNEKENEFIFNEKNGFTNRLDHQKQIP